MVHIPFLTSGSYPLRAGNFVRPLIDGIPAFRRIAEVIEAAQHSVWLTVAFFADDFRMPGVLYSTYSTEPSHAASTFVSSSGDPIPRASVSAELFRGLRPTATCSRRADRVSASAGIERMHIIYIIRKAGWSMRASQRKWRLSAGST